MSRARALRMFVASLFVAAATAQAQPKFVHTSNATDLTADGNSIVGAILDPNVDVRIHIFTRGSGHTFPGPIVPGYDGRLLISDDRQFISAGLYNGLFGPQNPAFGNYAPTAACCNGSTCTMVAPASCTGTVMANSCTPTPCPASTNPALQGACCTPVGDCTVTTRAACASPNYWVGNWNTCGTNICKHGHFVAQRLNTTTGVWTNAGSFPNIGGIGAAMCDANINNPYGLSSTGRFIAGGGEYGAYGTTSCQTRGFLYDANDGSVRLLPLVGGGCQPFSQGERVSTNGLVVMGSDSHVSPDNVDCNARCLTVWERGSDTSDFQDTGRTVLDGWGAGGLGSAAMNSAGTVIAASLSDGQAIQSGLSSADLVKYVKNVGTGAWDRVALGHCADVDGESVVCMSPFAISDDGNTIVGTARYSQCGFFGTPRTFFWRNNVNNGIPMLLGDYLASINGGNPFPPNGTFSPAQAISADGNAILGSVSLPDAVCPEGQFGLQPLPQAGILYLNGASIGCEPPRIAGGPYSKVQEEYTIFGIVHNVFASGSYPMTWQWQKESPAGSNNWTNLADSCGGFEPDANNPWSYEGTTGPQLRINMLAPSAIRDGNYRVVINNACGTATSPVAVTGVVAGACCYNSGGSIVCSVELETRCSGSPVISYFLGGAYLGDNTTCSPTTCPAVTGACCFGAGGPNAQCVLDVEPNCVRSAADGGDGGVFVGAGSVCGPTGCSQISGACCYSPSATENVVCTAEIGSYCSQAQQIGGLSGAYRGNGTTCQPTSCNSVAGACCYSPDAASNLICTVQTQTRCTNLIRNAPVEGYVNGLQGIYVGNGTTCLPINQQCGFVAGACCYSLDDTSSAICTLQLQDRCTRATNNLGLGGSYRGDGTTCVPDSCTNVTGACCYTTFDNPEMLLCTIQPATRCSARFNAGGLFGFYKGGGTSCSPTACDAVVGACCFSSFSSTCTICGVQPKDANGSTSQRCSDPVNGGLGGTFGAVGSNCSTPPCDLQIGACCVFEMACFTICADDCTNLFGGTPRGTGTTCTPDPCAQQPGACCCGSHCSMTIATACSGANTTFAGAGTACTPFSSNAPCCRGNFNKSAAGPGAPGGVSVQDIFDFLTGYFSNDPCANTNDSAAGPNAPNGISVQDIFDFLAAYFGGC